MIAQIAKRIKSISIAQYNVFYNAQYNARRTYIRRNVDILTKTHLQRLFSESHISEGAKTREEDSLEERLEKREGKGPRGR